MTTRSCFVAAALLAGCLAGCASTPAPRAGDVALLDDGLFASPAERIDADAVFALSAPMQAFADTELADAVRAQGPQLGLFEALYRRGEPWLDYDAAITRTASEAFAARSGNCLSLVLMTAAFARQLGLGVRFQSIDTWKSWSRDEGLLYLNSHVNVVLLPPGGRGGETVIDFMPTTADQLQHTRVVSEDTIVAKYLNNRAVELLARHELDRAYWWTRAAMARDPALLDAVNTLAVVYNQRGRPAQAEHALRWLLAREPDNLAALENLGIALRAQGRGREADAVARQLEQLRPVPPFHYYDLGQAALAEGRYADAKQLFRKEMRRDARYDKFHAALALAHYALGELDKAQAQMAIAVANSTTAGDRALYARLLERLRKGQHP